MAKVINKKAKMARTHGCLRAELITARIDYENQVKANRKNFRTLNEHTIRLIALHDFRNRVQSVMLELWRMEK